MHDHAPILDGRVTRHLAEKIRPAEVSVVARLEVAVAPLTDAPGSDAIGAVPGVVGQGEPVPPAVGLALDYEPFEVGGPWGPAWGTTWMRFRGTVPESLRGETLEAVVDLGGEYDSPGFQCEGLVFRADGGIVKAHNPRNQWIPVEAGADGRFEFYLEAAANPVVLGDPAFIETELGQKTTAGPAPLYALRRADLVVVHPEVRELAADITTLRQLAAELPEESERRWEIRRALDRALDRLALFDIPATATAARAELADVLSRPAAASAHTLSAIGHAHIDSAWLWPLRETRRKAARTIANQLNLLDLHPEHRFAFPAAQHAAWIEEDHPELFERLRAAVAAGGIIPVGGMWVESDANLPGGEAMCRQLLYGRAYYRDRFGVSCPEVWLPDSFGYSGALPQLAKLAGAQWFLTQKISWNQVDDFPHHSFWWEGIDGTRIFTHSHRSNHNPTCRAGRALPRQGPSPRRWFLGRRRPTREMLAQATRAADLEGSPRVRIEAPAEFFARAEAEHESPSVWVGELYLEAHRGTFTSVAAVKAGNRRSEHLLREAELWCATAAVRGLMEYPLARLGELWRQVCLYQFHDILPGTCIAWVYEEVREGFTSIAEELNALIDGAQRLLAGEGQDVVTFNASPFAREGVPSLGAAVSTQTPRRAPDASTRSRSTSSTRPAGRAVEARKETGGFVVDNGLLRLAVDDRGRVTSLVDLATGRDAVPPGVVGNLLQLHPDFPNQWDAWDIDAAAFNTVTPLDDGAAELVEADGGASVVVRRAFGASTATQTLTVLPGDPRLHVRVDVDWRERDSLLKLAWPVDVHTDRAAFEIEMGHLVRPTHANTSWDAHRFEVHAHRWVHVGEPGFSVAIANAQTYGWDVTRHPREGGGTYSLVRASLLKGARYPDPRTDVGRHTFTFTVRPGATVEDAVADGYAANLSPRTRPGSPVAPLIDVEGPVAVEAVKLAEDGSGDVIVRLYEPYGRRATATLTASFSAASAVETDLLEAELVAGTPGQQVAPTAITTPLADGEIGIALRPFQVATIRWSR